MLDVKGTLRDKLGPALRGNVHVFSTDPHAASDTINFLADCDPRDETGLQRIQQLIAALLPKDGWESGEQSYFYQNHVSWFEALLNVLLLDAHYEPARYPGGVPAFADLYDMARDESALYAVLDRVHAAERSGAAPPSPQTPPLNWWFGELALLVERAHGGRRSARYEYQELTRAIVNALRPFSRYGTLYRRTGGPPREDAGGAFSLADLGRGALPTTIVIAAREQDVGVAETVLRIVVTRLQQLLFDRFRQVQAKERIPPILLLLDETRRIPQFDPGRYITFAREAQASCVIAYQSLDQIGEAEKIVEILENVGTQVYLGSLVGNTARHVVEMLPRRERPTFSHTSSLGSDGASRGVQSGTEAVPYFSTMDLVPAARRSLARARPGQRDAAHQAVPGRSRHQRSACSGGPAMTDRTKFHTMPDSLQDLRERLAGATRYDLHETQVDRALRPTPVQAQQPSVEYETSTELKRGVLGEEGMAQEFSAKGRVIVLSKPDIKTTNQGGFDLAAIGEAPDGGVALYIGDNKAYDTGKKIPGASAMEENREQNLADLRQQLSDIANDGTKPPVVRYIASVGGELLDRGRVIYVIGNSGATVKPAPGVTPRVARQGIGFEPASVDNTTPPQPVSDSATIDPQILAEMREPGFDPRNPGYHEPHAYVEPPATETGAAPPIYYTPTAESAPPAQESYTPTTDGSLAPEARYVPTAEVMSAVGGPSGPDLTGGFDPTLKPGG